MAFIPHLVVVTPNITDDNPADDTLTVRRDKHDGDWLGRLPRGFICKAVEEYVLGDKRFYRLEKHVTAWPSATWNGLEVWANAAYLPEYNPAPVPDPTPAPGDGSLKSLAAKIGQALLDWSEE